ncbi:MAG: hypothetical protein ACPIG6_06305 [Akkermansiaceae bacterium]
MSDKYDRLEKANINNITEKIRQGKTLTASDKRAIENYRRKEAGLRPQKTEQELAKEFGVDRVGSIVKWKKRNAPFDGTDAEMYQWMIDNSIKGAAAWRKAYRDANPEQFPTKKTAKKKQSKKKLELKSAEELMQEYYAEVLHAREIGDDAREKIALDAYLKIEKQIREQEAHAKKLGIDKGEMLPKSEVIRILRALIWAGNACCHKYAKQIAQRLSEKSPAEVYKALAPILCNGMIFEGLKKITKPPGEVNVPQYVVDCFTDEREHYLRDE